MNKTQFVRSNPHLSAAELIALAARSYGMKLTPAHIYTIRSSIKRSVARALHNNGHAVAPNSRGLDARVQALSAAFVDELLAAISGASVRDILGGGA